MNPSLAEALATRVGGMRTALARIELAASQLARGAATPAARDLASGISEAVAHLDAEVEASLRLIRPAGSAASRSNDLGPELAELRERIEPVLRARGIAWEADAPEARSPVAGDPRAMRRAALALLRCAATWCGPGGRLGLRLVADGDRNRLGLALHLQPGPGKAETSPGIESFALAQGCDCEVTRSPGATRAVLWIPRQEAPCNV